MSAAVKVVRRYLNRFCIDRGKGKGVGIVDNMQGNGTFYTLLH
jgi:hypothetical protein